MPNSEANSADRWPREARWRYIYGMTDPAPAEAPKRRSLLRKFLLGLLALVLVVVLAAAGYVGYLWYRVPQDHLDPLRPGSASVVGEGAAPPPAP